MLDLLEAIIQPPGLVKEELRPILFKIDQFRCETTTIRVLPKSQKFQNGFAHGPSPFFEAANPFVEYLTPLGAKYFEEIIVLARTALICTYEHPCSAFRTQLLSARAWLLDA